ncbi:MULTISPECIES: amino acid permease [Pseudomonas]|uniref:GABA permease n=2 Tax=Pseudomonas TaxID=286 RepID=A0A2R7UG00_PSEDL|nr:MULTISPECIES: amino acid permease [Pseudomonas]MBF8644726.1 amino acid permease [Pseudomonas pudica]MBF8759552.1 amino acid permease [Pseudomonas pudica]MRF40210.1 amino acid permease [Escherichia coli]PTU50034.1 GABA permease [Pseudomonas plecoglossicida]
MSQVSLQHGLTSRQVSMISIAGIIGAGLFIGSSKAIASAGPAILVSYAMTGLLVLLVMRMLGEMAVANPTSGSFSTYAAEAIGPWAGFTIGWLYWWFWVLIIPVEAIAGADILHAWFPAVPSWLFAFLIMAVLATSNLVSVKNFGEFEFWFALVKVIAILAFIVIGGMALFGVWPLAEASGVSHLWANGGFAPNGWGAVLGGVLITIFSFFGAEIVTIAADETANPQAKIRRATNLVVYRIAVFYLASIFLVVSLVAWNDPALVAVGSFQRVLEVLNVPGAKLVVDVVVLVAVTSCMNSGLYTASRMLHSLGARGEALPITRRVTANGVPVVAVLMSTLAGFAGCLVNYVFPGKVFSFLLSTTGAIALLVYLVIAISQLRMRARAERDGVQLELKMWLFPWLTWLVIGAILMVLGYMLLSDAYRYEALMTAGVTVFILLVCVTRRRVGMVGRAVYGD